MNCTRQLTSGLGLGLLLLLGACGGDSSSSNEPPAITDLADVTVSANQTSMPFFFNVMDDRNPAGVTLSASSSAPAVLADDGIRFGGSGTSRTVTVTPQPGVQGTAVVTVVATDGRDLQASSDFTVTVVTQNVSFSAFFRETFSDAENDEPRDLNSRSFDQDAEEGEFDDLIGAQ